MAANEQIGATLTRDRGYVQWAPVIAGAIAAAALAVVLNTFGAGIGLAVSSTAPTWRDSSPALWFLSGIYLILVAVAAYSLGGYVAGRMREPIAEVTADDRETRDGTHGLLVWALATLLAVVIVGLALPAVTRLAAAPPASGSSTSVAGENIIAFDLDRLLRGARTTDLEYPRAEASRILLTSTGHNGIAPDDRSYLIRRVSELAGLSAGEAERRTDAVIESARQDIQRARHAAVLITFCAGAAALIGAAFAWFTACLGGEHRDRGSVPLWGTLPTFLPRRKARRV